MPSLLLAAADADAAAPPVPAPASTAASTIGKRGEDATTSEFLREEEDADAEEEAEPASNEAEDPPPPPPAGEGDAKGVTEMEPLRDGGPVMLLTESPRFRSMLATTSETEGRRSRVASKSSSMAAPPSAFAERSPSPADADAEDATDALFRRVNVPARDSAEGVPMLPLLLLLAELSALPPRALACPAASISTAPAATTSGCTTPAAPPIEEEGEGVDVIVAVFTSESVAWKDGRWEDTPTEMESPSAASPPPVWLLTAG